MRSLFRKLTEPSYALMRIAFGLLFSFHGEPGVRGSTEWWERMRRVESNPEQRVHPEKGEVHGAGEEFSPGPQRRNIWGWLH